MRKGRQTLGNPKEVPKIVEIFAKRLGGKTFAKIARITSLKRDLVRRIILDPIYANKRKIPGKPPNEWPDAGVELVIPFETWLKAQKIFSDHKPWSLALETKKQKETENRNKVLTYIASKEPEGARFKDLKEIALKMKRSESQLKRYLQHLKGEAIEKTNGKWHVKKEYLLQQPPQEKE